MTTPTVPSTKPHADLARLEAGDAATCATRIWEVCSLFSRRDITALDSCTPFHSCAVPTIPLHRYWLQLWARTRYGRPCLSFAIVLVQRYWSRTGTLPSQLTAHRLLATALLIASKLHQDRVYSNATFATACGLPLAELNRLEVAFLTAISFDTHVSALDIDRVVGKLLSGASVAEHAVAIGVDAGDAPVPRLSIESHSSSDSQFIDDRGLTSPTAASLPSSEGSTCARGHALRAVVALRLAQRDASLRLQN